MKLYCLMSAEPVPTSILESVMAPTHQLRVEEIFSLKDYVCLVTGGGTGIGLMATQALAANGKSAFTEEIIPASIADTTEQGQRSTSLGVEWRCCRMRLNPMK